MTYVGSCVSLVGSILDALDVHDFASAAPRCRFAAPNRVGSPFVVFKR